MPQYVSTTEILVLLSSLSSQLSYSVWSHKLLSDQILKLSHKEYTQLPFCLQKKCLMHSANTIYIANFDYKKCISLRQDTTDWSLAQQEAEKQAAEKQVAVLEKQVDVSNAQLKAAQQQSSASQTQANGVGTQVNLAQVGLQQSEANVDFAKLQLSYAYIIAPCDGFISKKNVQVGQLLNPGQIVMSIVDESQLWITANFKETQIEKMKVGQDVTVNIDAYPDHQFKGKIESIQAATGSKFSLLPADNATGNFVKVVQRIPVRIALVDDKNDTYDLRAGMNVDVAVKVK